jgi:hypothetical protein
MPRRTRSSSSFSFVFRCLVPLRPDRWMCLALSCPMAAVTAGMTRRSFRQRECGIRGAGSCLDNALVSKHGNQGFQPLRLAMSADVPSGKLRASPTQPDVRRFRRDKRLGSLTAAHHSRSTRKGQRAPSCEGGQRCEIRRSPSPSGRGSPSRQTSGFFQARSRSGSFASGY